MVGLRPFSLRHECPKCGSDAWDWQFRESGWQDDGEPAVDHIRLVCQRCGYTMRTLPRDAVDSGDAAT